MYGMMKSKKADGRFNVLITEIVQGGQRVILAVPDATAAFVRDLPIEYDIVAGRIW